MFYDLTVPGPAHYSAEGMIHHNSGKTTLASTIAKLGPTLFIDLTGEKGVRAFKGADYATNITVARPDSATELDDLFWALDKGGHGFKAVVIDSITSVQKMTMRFLLGHDETAVREIKQGTAPADIRTWGQSSGVMEDLSTFWHGLADGNRKEPMHVVFTAQTKIREDEVHETVTRTPDVQPGALSTTLSTPDYILYTEEEENPDAVGDESQPGTRFILRLGGHPGYRTKTIVPAHLRGKIPSVIGRGKNGPDLAQLAKVLEIGGTEKS